MARSSRLAVLVAALTLLAASCAQVDAAGRAPSNAATPSETPVASATTATSSTSSATASATPSPTKTVEKPLLTRGDKGDKVRELQHRLLQQGWFSGKITGTYGASTVTAVKGFQKKRKLKATGAVDKKTWAVLVKRTKQPTRDQMYNIIRAGKPIWKQGSQGLKVRELQARLKQIGWFSGNVTGFYGSDTVASVKGFQAKRGIPVVGFVDQRTWDRLVGMTRPPTHNELYNIVPKVSAGLDPRCVTSGKVLCISKRTATLRYVVGGKVQRVFAVRFGSELTPTREGVFSVTFKSRDHVSSLYHTPMPYALFFSGGQAVHYPPDFAARGYNGASHGCVNVRDRAGIAWLFDQVPVGTKVVVYR